MDDEFYDSWGETTIYQLCVPILQFWAAGGYGIHIYLQSREGRRYRATDNFLLHHATNSYIPPATPLIDKEKTLACTLANIDCNTPLTL